MKQPNTLIIVSVVLILVTLLSWILPAGQYQRTTHDNREILVPGSYKKVEQSPQGIFDVLLAPIKGFVASARIIAFVLIIGGVFSIITRTQAIEAGLQNVIQKSLTRPAYKKVIIPLLMTLFSIAGATFGLSEEVLLFILITIPFAKALGYNAIVGVAIPFVAAGVGFAGAITNPFTVGIAQGIAGLHPFSGWEYRIVVWFVLTLVAILYVARYANRIEVKHEPNQGNEAILKQEFPALTWQRSVVLLLFLLSIGLLIVGSTRWGWYIDEITGLFTGLGILVALVARISPNETAESFIQGARNMLSAALVIALAKGILIVSSEGKIIDTMLFYLTNTLQGAHPVLSAEIMFMVQNTINFLVPSGSGQAALTMPIMAPLSDLLSISRQTAVLIFQLGDGIGNMIIPTSGVTMGVLSAADIPYSKWLRWVWPLIVILIILSMLLIIPPVLMGWV